MDQTQQKALNALEPFVLLSKSAISPRAAADLITQATSAPNTYVFAELLQTPNIQALRTADSDYSSYLTLLEIFAWGTWADYNSTPDLPPLTPPQTLKLRQLTLLTLCTTPPLLTYPSLLSLLSLPHPRALETLVISCIYANLISATLSPLTSRIIVSSVSPLRDLPPNSTPLLLSVLEDWDARCVGVLGELEAKVGDVRGRAREKRRREREGEERFERAVGGGEAPGGEKEKGKGSVKRGAGEGEMGEEGEGGKEGGEEMDLDEGGGRGGARTAKRGGGRRGYGSR